MAGDLGHGVPGGRSDALVDPQLGADQLPFILSDRWQQPDGHMPCAEFVMADECPPVFAWAAWRVARGRRGRRVPPGGLCRP